MTMMLSPYVSMESYPECCCNWFPVLVVFLAGILAPVSLHPDHNKQLKALTTTTGAKCVYNLIVHEVDSAVKCPKIERHSASTTVQADSPAKSPSRFMHRAYRLGLEDLVSRVGTLETKLYAEMAENRELKNTLLLQEQWLKKMERFMQNTVAHNLTQLGNDVRDMGTRVDKHSTHYRSLDNKLSEVMLDVAEVNNYLASGKHRAAEDGELDDDKNIPVQATSLLRRGCGVPTNGTKFSDCAEVYKRGHTRSGVYYITPIYSPCPIPVYCDMDTPPGGWLVLQRRTDGTTSFNRNWYEYRMGFGDVMREFWLGLDNLFLLTNQKHYSLRVDLWDFAASRVFAEYKHFKVDGERDQFRVHVRNYTGTAGDGLTHHHGVYFSTPDRDNDAWDDYHCAKEWGAGWWFNNCWFVILNGKYYNSTRVKYRGISWNDWKAEQLKSAEMKIRPLYD